MMHYMIFFIQPCMFHFPKTTPICFFTPVHTEPPCIFPIHLLLSKSTSHSLSIEQHVCTATSHPVAHVPFVSLSFPHKHAHIPSPAYLPSLSMSLTFGSAISEVQSIVLPGLTDLCCFVDRIQTGLVLCPPKCCSPSTPRIREQPG